MTCCVVSGAAQDKTGAPNLVGSWYAYWGWHEVAFTKSDMRFTGAEYDFTLRDVIGDGRQRKWSFNDYLNPARGTIPQFNFRVGYYLKPDLDISFGLDHMKYVVRTGQPVAVEGTIAGSGTELDGLYDGEQLHIERWWLRFEHTDGLNYFNLNLRKHQSLCFWRFVDVRAFGGGGLGILTPRTDANLFGRGRHDKYRLAGYALSASAGINVTLWRVFFLQAELNGGFFHITSARTTQSVDRVAHHAWFGQSALEFGGRWSIGSNSE